MRKEKTITTTEEQTEESPLITEDQNEAVPEPEKDPAKAAQEGLRQKKKKRGKIGGLFQKVGEKVGMVEQTKISPEFMHELEKYVRYQDYVDHLVDHMESKLKFYWIIVRYL